MKSSLKISLLLSFTMLTSCSRYYVYHTSCGKNVNNTESEYVYENDTVKIAYDFWDNHGKMSFSIYNKLNIPIFVDWKNSALIINDNKYAYWEEKEIKKGHSSNVSYKGISSGSENSTTIKVERVTSMPPHSKMKKLSADKLTNPKRDASKMTFRNFIALSTNEDVKNDAYVDNEFSVTQVETIKGIFNNKIVSKKFFYTTH